MLVMGTQLAIQQIEKKKPVKSKKENRISIQIETSRRQIRVLMTVTLYLTRCQIHYTQVALLVRKK